MRHGASARRGVHHSGGLRAKRRWLRWRRYQRRCDLLVAPRTARGYVVAAHRWAYTGRYPPIGIRDVRP